MKRRDLLLSSTGLLFVASACKRQVIESTNSQLRPTQEPPNTLETSSTTTSTQSLDTPTEEEDTPPPSCDLSVRTTINLSQLAPVDETLTPVIMAYGSLASATIAVGFPKFQYEKNLTDIYLCDETGQLIAHKAVFVLNDVQNLFNVRPQVFEHVQVPPQKKLGVVLKMGSALKKFIMDRPLVFTTTYDKHTVRTIYGSFPLDQWQDYFFTDLLGNFITLDRTQGIAALLSYMYIIAYKTNPQGTNERTLLRLG